MTKKGISTNLIIRLGGAGFISVGAFLTALRPDLKVWGVILISIGSILLAWGGG